MQCGNLQGKLNNPTIIYEPGKSAYDIALEHGFNGTEEEWLESLKGPRGEQGPQGVQGERGIPGKDGQDGAKGDTGANGKSVYQIWIELGNSGTEEEFMASLTGPQGLQGEQGIKGDKGDTGEQGPAGPQGLKGEKGQDGTNGTNGVTPIKGVDYYTDTEKQELMNSLKTYCNDLFETNIQNALGGEY